MQGLELAKRYYEEVGRPMLERDFPELLPRLAAGLVGEGSECLGFDDAISQDHDFGAGFCLWFSAEDYNQYGNALQDAYDRLPGEFAGVPARLTSARGGGRVGVFEIEAFYSRFIGMEQPPKSLMLCRKISWRQSWAGQYLRMDWENFLRSARRSGSIIRRMSGSRRSRRGQRKWHSRDSIIMAAVCGGAIRLRRCWRSMNLCGRRFRWSIY